MISKQLVVIALRKTGLVFFIVILVAFAATKTEMFLERYHDEQLMSDMHKIRLYQSTWADGQQLMSRWGAWGHYDGTCTAADCLYSINLGDENIPTWQLSQWLMEHGGFSVCSWLGNRYPRLRVSFTVHNGTVWRTTASLGIYVLPKFWELDDSSYFLAVNTKSRQRLHRTKSDWWILGSDDDLAEHPYYKAGRPGGCTNCEEAVVSYSTHTPPVEIERLTSFNFSCLTRFLRCTTPADLLPAGKDLYLYRDDEGFARQQKLKSAPPKPCNIPLWALGRDQNHVLVIDTLSTSSQKTWDGFMEISKVKIVESLKGTSPWPLGSVITLSPFSGNPSVPSSALAEHLLPNQRYIVLPMEDDYDAPVAYSDGSVFGMARCGVQNDTPEVRRELAIGYAQNDDLPGSEMH